MVKCGWSCVIVGILVTAVVGCSKPAIEEEQEFSPSEEAPLSLATDPATAVSATTSTQAQPTITPPPLPTAAPTTSIFNTWQQSGNAATGLQLLTPPEWINLSGRLDTPAAANELGLIVLLLADSERTGESLLSGKPLGAGAYVAGIISHHELPPNTPQASLSQLINQLDKNVTPLNEPTPVTAFTGSGSRITGAYADVAGEPFLFGSGQQDIHTRIFLFASSLAGPVNQDTQALFLMSAPAATWPQTQPLFNEMARTIVVHNIETDFTIRDGAANVVGELGELDMVNGSLTAGVKDVWTFNLDEPRYATITLIPDNEALDLTFTLVSPSGQTVAQVDNGYAGDTETAVDRLLLENGLYVLEVGEFFNEPGRYTLSLILTQDPYFGGGGDIQLGQTIQSDLPAGGQHLWHFMANAGAPVSLVLDPGSFDGVLSLYAPDGRELVSLDEGFSGDAEVVSGLPLPLTGEYTILVRSFAGDGGEYTLSLNEGGDETINFYDAGDLVYGQTQQETLQANEAHAWFFSGLAGDEIMAEVIPLSTQLDLDIWLLDPNVERLTAVDKLLAGQPEYLAYTLPQDGQYILLIRDFFGESGAYEITLQAMPTIAPDTAGTIANGQTVAGTLNLEQTVVWYFDGRAGEAISVRLQPENAAHDLRFFLIDPAGNRLLEMDNGAMGQAEELNGFRLSADGQWGIVVEEFFDEEAAYTLTLSQTP